MLRFLLIRLVGILVLCGSLLAARSAAAQWVNQTSGLPQYWGINFISIVDANNVWATAQDDGPNNLSGTNPTNTYIRTTNGGTTWTVGTIPDAANLSVVSVAATSPTVAWIASDDYNNGGARLYYTADGGTTWTRQLSTGFTSPASSIDGVLAFSPTQAVVVGDAAPGNTFEIYTTTNGGTTWTAATTPARLDAYEFGISTTVVTVPGPDPGARSCWMGTFSGRVLRSTDSGLTWTAALTGLDAVTALAFSDAKNGIATNYTASSTFGMIAVTSDGGVTWKVSKPSGRFFPTCLAGVPGRANTYVSLGFDGSNTSNGAGSSYSTDGGLTWTAIDALKHYTVAFLNSSTGYSGGFAASPTSGGMYRGSLPAAALATTAARPLAGLGVYPNPASEGFTVAVPAVADAAQVQATLYNALGQAVARQQASLPPTGGQLHFPTTGLAAGLYTLRVQAGDRVASQPVSLH